MQILTALTNSIRGAATFNPDVQSPPVCILWPDGDRQWEAVVPRLQHEMPELFQLGDYAPDKRIGAAIWIRCVIANTIKDVSIPTGVTPVLYLPGITRQDLRAVESCPDHLKPLAELQFRGVIWSQVNAKDWTVLAFLKSNQGGLGLDVAQDTDSKHAMQLALYRVLDEEIEILRGKHLDKDYFNTLLSGGDPVRDLLQWLDQGDAFKNTRDENAWRGFVEVCKSQLGFDPENDGPLKAATLLAYRKGSWDGVWGRFCEAPARYLNVPSWIRKTSPPQDLYEDKTAWPQINEKAETSLRQDLLQIAKSTPHAARGEILEAEQKHAARRKSVWADLKEAPLAMALQHLAQLANVTKQSLAAGNVNDMAAAYQTIGWTADAAALEALTCVQKPEDFKTIEAVLQTIYLPWMDEAASYLQSQIQSGKYPRGISSDPQLPQTKVGHCIVFVDGLRFDLAKSLESRLQKEGYTIESAAVWAALPSVTATAKPAIAPIRHLVRGQEVNSDFEPSVAATGQSLKGGYHFKKLLKDNGWQVLDRSETGDPDGSAWTEVGDVDHEGHVRGAQLARHINAILTDICDRIIQLSDAGWKNIRIVTDHGWLLMPGGLPKASLPSALADNTWGRCAAIKPGAVCNETLFPWYWNIDLSFALAPGVRCYREGVEYTHGGLSLQECLVLCLSVSKSSAASGEGSIEIKDVNWKGMRCKVVIDGYTTGLRLDIRTHAGNASSSLAMSDKPFKDDGVASVVVKDDSLEGHEATVVVINERGQLVGQSSTVIGRNES
jgi:hypothetical protein